VTEKILFPGGFTVLMAVYRGDDPILLKKAIESVMSNSLIPNSLLMVIDGPLTMDLNLVLKGYKTDQFKRTIKIIRLNENVGLAKALNIGLNCVSDRWVVRADADDINVPTRFSTLASAILSNPEIQMFGSDILEIDENGEPIGVRSVPKTQSEIAKYIKRRNPFNHMSVAYQKDIILAAGGYPNIFLREDYGLWIKLLKNNIKMMNIEAQLVLVTSGKNLFIRRGGLKYAFAEYQLQKILYDCNLKKFHQCIIDGSIRFFIFILPWKLRALVYKNILRKK